MKKNDGFTLIELMIVVAIIGVLSAIAIPKYQQHVRNTHEKAMGILIKDTISDLKRWRGKMGGYNLAGTSTNPAPTIPTQYPATGIAVYTIELIANELSGNTFVIKITAQGAQTKQACTTLIINQLGVVKSTSTETIKSNSPACDTIIY